MGRDSNKIYSLHLLLLSLWLFCPVLASAFLSVFYSCGVKLASNNGVSETDILYTTASKQDNGVLLKRMTNARNVRRHFHAVCKSDSSDFSDCGVWFLRSLCRDFYTNASLERRIIKTRTILYRVEPLHKRHCFWLCRNFLALSFN